MRWLRLAADDVVESRRNRTIYALAVLFALTGALAGWLLGESVKTGTDLTFPVIVFQLMAILVPLTAVGISYDAIVSQRAVGSLHLLLGLPYVRRDVFLGTYVGRTVQTIVGTAVGFVFVALVGILIGGGDALADPVAILLAFGLIALFAIVFTGLGLTFSMVTRSTSIAATGAFLVLVLFLFMWGTFLQLLVFLLDRLGISASPDAAWVTFLNAVNPHNAIKAVASLEIPTLEGVAPLVSGATFYQTPAFAALVIVVWAVVVPGLGYLVFRRADL